ncbi:FAD-dependent oxidoreductase [Sphaerotilus microaerophilus]|uniref:FAD-binding dehydrogenase n=1 Tax=Sphaerotilus microaerophilus TaxID=2914710 RepID=A0ABN6PJN8_9BURK|nr:FAD-dependent oxidoreductase [Sphaerotilus sp. FB-5]BDI03702.1 FAD-binding dehydrogenase [Sphaerotilus sp. FB-5]
MSSAAPAPASFDCDLLVLGSGAGALSAAVTAAHLGLKVIVAEKEPVFGGTTAWSGGWMWIPRNPLAVAAGIAEPIEEPRRYLQGIVGRHLDAQRAEAFLTYAPQMVQFHLDHTALRFIDGNAIPDFHGRAEAARTGGRSVCAAPFDGARLGTDLKRLRPPAPLLSFLGMSIGSDLRHFLRAGRAWDSFFYAARRTSRHLLELALHGQGRMRLGGNALAAALLKSALDAGVSLRERHAAIGLIEEGEGSSGRIVGARLRTPQGEVTLRARCGVVCACGGFPHDDARKAALFPHAPHGYEHRSAAVPSNTGDGLRLAEAAGARVATDLADAGAWCPVSVVPNAPGGLGNFPHLAERGKPGLIAVDRAGRRFVDEAGNYHSFMRALFARCAQDFPGQPVEAWLVVDHRFLRRWGLGAVRPFPLPYGAHLKSGYLKRGATLAELAAACGIDAAGLQRTVAEHNADAREGRDRAFDRGGIPYDRMQGDAEHPGPNPCVAPIEQGPFYAVKVVPGSLGTFAGLAVNAHGQVLRADGSPNPAPIPGLYAAGNDMASVMGGHYPSGGITLGPGMTFGWILAHHASGRPLPLPEPPTLPVPPVSTVAPVSTPSPQDLRA